MEAFFLDIFFICLNLIAFLSSRLSSNRFRKSILKTFCSLIFTILILFVHFDFTDLFLSYSFCLFLLPSGSLFFNALLSRSDLLSQLVLHDTHGHVSGLACRLSTQSLIEPLNLHVFELCDDRMQLFLSFTRVHGCNSRCGVASLEVRRLSSGRVRGPVALILGCYSPLESLPGRLRTLITVALLQKQDQLLLEVRAARLDGCLHILA